jgi:hypothetical protein
MSLICGNVSVAKLRDRDAHREYVRIFVCIVLIKHTLYRHTQIGQSEDVHKIRAGRHALIPLL